MSVLSGGLAARQPESGSKEGPRGGAGVQLPVRSPRHMDGATPDTALERHVCRGSARTNPISQELIRMTIIATTAAPLRPRAVSDGVEEVVAEAWTVYEEVQNLSRLGVEVAVTVSRQERITVALAVSAEAAGLLPTLVREMEHSALTRTPSRYTVTGTICQGNVRLQVAVDAAEVTVAELEALVAAVDVDFDEAFGAGDEYVKAGWAA